MTRPLVADRSTVVYGPSIHSTFEQEGTLRIDTSAPFQPVAPQPLPQAHMVIQPQVQAPPQPPPQSQPPTYLTYVPQLVPTLTSAAPSAPAPYTSALAV